MKILIRWLYRAAFLLYDFSIMTNNETKNLIQRPPIVVVMGHVDHGKTQLLDYIRKTSVVEKEAGGITQHIGAYEITHKERKITFLDTPGHEAFSKIRARGAHVADIAVLVVAADEGVKPQTIEALGHIKKSELPFIVAINKIDKPNANPEKVKKELADNGVLLESWGGQISSVELSAKEGTKVEELLDLIGLLADVADLKADPNSDGRGVVIEARRDPRRGPTASLVVLDGTVKVGDYIAASSISGRVKALEDFLGKPVGSATFSSPALVIGLEDTPDVGAEFITSKEPITAAIKMAKQLGDFIEKTLEPEVKPNYVYAIVKGDVQSSVEALTDSLNKIKLENGAVKVLKSEAGDVNESDLKQALTTRAVVVAFNVKIDSAAQNMIRSLVASGSGHTINIVEGKIIYELLDSFKEKAEARLKPRATREELGRLDILAIFRQEKNRQVIGGEVAQGKAVKNTRVEVMRKDMVLGEGRITNLQQEKKDVSEVLEGKECGMVFEPGEPKIAAGDMLIFFKKLV